MFIDLEIDFSKDDQKAFFIQLIKDTQGKMIIYAESKGNVRSMPLNNFYWVILEYCSEYCGMDSGYMHNFFKEMFIPAVKWGAFGRLSTTEMTTKQMMQYLGWIRAYMLSEHKVKLPDPESNRKKIIRPA